MIEGISHVTFIVKDLERAAVFFKEILGAQEIYSSGNQLFSLSTEKFFLIGNLWVVAMEGETAVEPGYNHLALKIADADFENYERKITALGLTMKTPRPRVEGEGRSLYFYDFDNHLFELHTGTLQERMARYSYMQGR